MAPTDDIAVATSIPPVLRRQQGGHDIGLAYQASCVRSWVAAGFKILSVNAPDEIEQLAPRYPEVEFVAAKRDVSAISGRKMPLIEDLLVALSHQAQPILGIINADLCLETGSNWAGAIAPAIMATLLVGHRVDVPSWPEAAGAGTVSGAPYQFGYDLFFFEKRALPAALTASAGGHRFAMGLPWWDLWLPLAFGLNGYRLALLTAPMAAHLTHPANYEIAVWERMGAETLAFAAAAGTMSRSAAWQKVVAEALRLAPAAGRELDRWVPGGALAQRIDVDSHRYRADLIMFSDLLLGSLQRAAAPIPGPEPAASR
jgi:hypothetical protein